MFTRKGKICSEAGKILVHKTKGFVTFESVGSQNDFTEESVDLNDMETSSGGIYFHHKLLYVPFAHVLDGTYDVLKIYMINKRYTMDDQMAIMLNKDLSQEDYILYIKMQEWREWASLWAKKVSTTWLQIR